MTVHCTVHEGQSAPAYATWARPAALELRRSTATFPPALSESVISASNVTRQEKKRSAQIVPSFPYLDGVKICKRPQQEALSNAAGASHEQSVAWVHAEANTMNDGTVAKGALDAVDFEERGARRHNSSVDMQHRVSFMRLN